MQQSSISLPPQVEGPVRGSLRLRLGPLSWSAAGPPPHLIGPLQARILWWGDPSGGDILPLPGRASAGLAFPLRCGPKYLTRYLRDAGCLAIAVEPAVLASGMRSAAPAAAALVGLLALDVRAHVGGTFPLVLAEAGGGDAEPTETIIGSLPVHLDLDYSGAVGILAADGASAPLSSFELNEHLASSAAAASDDSQPSDGGLLVERDGEADQAAAAALRVPTACTELAAALQDRALAAAALQQVVTGEEGDAALLDAGQLQRLAGLLMPGAAQHELRYAAAMLLPFGGSGDQRRGLSFAEAAAAAAHGAAVERSLQELPAAEATRCLRELAAALGSRSLDLAAAFAAADNQQLPLAELGALSRRLHPAAAADHTRCLLALLAAGAAASSGITLQALKAALALVLDAQQFPTAEDLERQQAAAAARQAKQSAAAAAAVVAQQRAAAAVDAGGAPLPQQTAAERKRVAVSRLKGQQQRRRSSNGAALGCPTQEPGARAPSAVVMGIPVVPPHAALPLPSPAASPQPEAALAAEAACVAAGPAATPLPAPVSGGQPSQPADSQAPPPAPQQPDPLLQLIQRAEQLKAALEQAACGGSGKGGPAASLAALASSAAAAPRLPNLLIPQPAAGAGAGADGALSEATAALVAAAKAVRLEGQREPPEQQPPAAAGPALREAGATEGLPSSDAESDAEDALLESLFFSPHHQPGLKQPLADAVAHAAAACGPAALPHKQPHERQEQQQRQGVLRVQLQSLHLTDASACGSVRCVVKPLCSGRPGQQLTLPVSAPPSAAALADPAAACPALWVELDAALPAAAAPAGQQASGSLLPHLFLEFWRHDGSLLGLAKVPLLQHEAALPAVVAAGRQAVSNILEGRQAGSILVAAVLQDAGTPPQLPAVRHSFGVRICSAHRLPSAAAYAAAGLCAPDGRLLRYSFPGEAAALQSKEVPCCGNPCFEAAAQHEVVLPAGQDILPLLQDGLLRFELFDCWADASQGQRRQQHGWALLPLEQLSGLVAEAEGGSSGEASRVLLLPLCTEYDSAAEAAAAAAGDGRAAQPGPAAASRGPSLKLELSYRPQLCTVGAQEAAACRGSVDAPAAAVAPRLVGCAPHGDGGKPGVCSSGSDDENSRAQANRGTWRRCSQRPGRTAAAGSGVAADGGVAQPAPAGLAAAPVPSERAVPAIISVEVVRACGLAAAVREAASTHGTGGCQPAGGLGRAATVGPHAFARLSLFPHDQEAQAQAPPLQTPFVAQSFCPAWQAVHSYELHLTARLLEALATQASRGSLRVEVWHRCPRAVAGPEGRREVLLGAGSAPLLDVLRKPCGLRGWLQLSGPAGGSLVGAVKVGVYLSQLGGLSVGGSGGGSEPAGWLSRCPEAAALLPRHLGAALLQPPGAGHAGEAAVLAVHLDALLPPSSPSGGRPKADRYCCRYSLPGSLASGDGVATAPRVLTAVAGSGAERTRRKSVAPRAEQQQQWAARLNHRGFLEVPAGPELAAALLQGPLQVHVYRLPPAASNKSSKIGSRPGLDPAARLGTLVGRAELDLSPLLWDVGPQHSGAAVDGVEGEVEHAQPRTVGGWYPLVDGSAAAQGGASLAATVQLQLVPRAPIAQQAAAAAAAGADACCSSWRQEEVEATSCQEASSAASSSGSDDAERDGRPSTLPCQALNGQQQAAAIAFACPSSSDDDEELLRHCRRLVSRSRGSRLGRQQQAQQPAGADEDGQPQQADEAAAGRDSTGAQPGAQPPAEQAQLASGAAGSGSAAAPALDSRIDEELEAPEGMLLVEVETALNLPTSVGPEAAEAAAQAGQYSAFVQSEWCQQRAAQRTPTVAVHVVEAGDLGGTAVWGAELELPATAAAWAPAARSDSSSPTLLLNVWGAPAAIGSLPRGGTAGDASLIGSAAFDLGPLPQRGSLMGWLRVIGADQQQRGQLKVTVRPNATLRSQLAAAAAPPAPAPGSPSPRPPPALSPLPLRSPGRQEQQQAGDGAEQQQGPGHEQEEELSQQDGAGLMQLQAQLQEVNQLSQRLAAAPAGLPAEQAWDAPVVEPLLQQQQQQQQQQLSGEARAAPHAGNGAPFGFGLADSEGEEDGCAPFDARLVGYAWSGSESDDDDPMALLGVTFEGAVSPGFSELEEEQEAPRQPGQPSLLLDDDWMFSISRTAHQPAPPPVPAAAGDGGPHAPQQQQRRPMVFRNVIPGGGPSLLGSSRPIEAGASASPRSQLPQTLPQRQGLLPGSDAEGSASPALRQPAVAQAAPGPAPGQAQQAAPGAAVSLPPEWAGQQPPALDPDWMFDICRPPQPASAAGAFSSGAAPGAAPAPGDASASSSQFTPMQRHAGLAAETPAAQQQPQAPSPAAATIDEVLQSLLAGGRGSRH